MKLNPSDERPIFLQIASEIEDAIFTGAFAEESQIPSTTEISTEFSINPATVLKGINILVDENIVYKKRGVGMFVKTGAVSQVKEKRKKQFYDNFILTAITEAKKLGLSKEEILTIIERGYENE